MSVQWHNYVWQCNGLVLRHVEPTTVITENNAKFVLYMLKKALDAFLFN